MLHLTTLEGAATAGRLRHICAQAVRAAPTIPEMPSVAAVSVHLSPVAAARWALEGTA